MNKTTKIIISAVAVIGFGSFAYLMYRKIKKAKLVANLFVVSALDKTTDTFKVFPQLTSKSIIVKRNNELNDDPKSKSSDKMNKKYKRVDIQSYPIGSIIEITNGGSLNGLYKVKLVTIDSTEHPTKDLGSLTLINNKNWDGSEKNQNHQ